MKWGVIGFVLGFVAAFITAEILARQLVRPLWNPGPSCAALFSEAQAACAGGEPWTDKCKAAQGAFIRSGCEDPRADEP
jgi:hypothetical protein